MILNEVITELRKNCPEFDGYVAGAADWNQLDLINDEAPAYPCAYVVPMTDQAETSDSAVDYRQTVTETFAVIAVIDLTDDSRGQAGFDYVKKTLQPSIFKAILGWSPDPRTYTEIQYAGAEVIYMDRKRMCYQFEFSFDYFLDVTDVRQGVDLVNLKPVSGFDMTVGIHPDLKPELTGKVSIKLEE